LQARLHPELPGGPYMLLTVSDTGTGMDEATKARIFEPFFTTKEIGKGTGLGLATVFGIIKQSGGFIEVQSALGTGTTFRTYLPQFREAARSTKSNPELVKVSKGLETILLVEDEDGVRELTQMILERSGYRVLQSRDGEGAIRLSKQYPDRVHILVTDVVMPKMGGRHLANCLVASRPGMKVLYMSGYTDDTLIRHGLENASTHFLAKPFTPMTLRKKVREVLDETSDPQDNGQLLADDVV
jgi:CheY-like chemotaxis protein